MVQAGLGGECGVDRSVQLLHGFPVPLARSPVPSFKSEGRRFAADVVIVGAGDGVSRTGQALPFLAITRTGESTEEGDRKAPEPRFGSPAHPERSTPTSGVEKRSVLRFFFFFS